jgi:MoaA/NifB/PqqE/SkfB family radical SAM enzyme
MQVIDWLAEMGVRGVSISGGEPTLHRDIVALLRHAKSHGLGVVLSTHGQFHRRAVECAPWVDWMALPIDGATEGMLVEMRGKAWGVDDAQRLVADAREANPDIKIKIGTVANMVNRLHVPAVGESLVERGLPVQTWKIYQYTARRQFKDRWRDYHLSDSAYAAVREAVQNRVPTSQFDIVYSTNDKRRAAYLFAYPDGTLSIPNQGPDMEDHVVGNLFLQGREVLDRVPTIIDSINHAGNYNDTYPGVST